MGREAATAPSWYINTNIYFAHVSFCTVTSSDTAAAKVGKLSSFFRSGAFLLLEPGWTKIEYELSVKRCHVARVLFTWTHPCTGSPLSQKSPSSVHFYLSWPPTPHQNDFRIPETYIGATTALYLTGVLWGDISFWYNKLKNTPSVSCGVFAFLSDRPL